MPILGPRSWYKYTTDNGENYRIQTSEYLAEAAGLERNDTLPFLPRWMKARYVWLQEVTAEPKINPARKKLIIQRADCPRFRPGTRMQVPQLEMMVTCMVGRREAFHVTEAPSQNHCQSHSLGINHGKFC